MELSYPARSGICPNSAFLVAPRPCVAFRLICFDLISSCTIDPGKIFDLMLPLEKVAEGYRAMDERRAIKTLFHP